MSPRAIEDVRHNATLIGTALLATEHRREGADPVVQVQVFSDAFRAKDWAAARRSPGLQHKVVRRAMRADGVEIVCWIVVQRRSAP